MAKQSGDGGFSNPTMYASVEDLIVNRDKQLLRVGNATITVGEFEGMDYESQRAWVANVTASEPGDVE